MINGRYDQIPGFDQHAAKAARPEKEKNGQFSEAGVQGAGTHNCIEPGELNLLARQADGIELPGILLQQEKKHSGHIQEVAGLSCRKKARRRCKIWYHAKKENRELRNKKENRELRNKKEQINKYEIRCTLNELRNELSDRPASIGKDKFQEVMTENDIIAYSIELLHELSVGIINLSEKKRVQGSLFELPGMELLKKSLAPNFSHGNGSRGYRQKINRGLLDCLRSALSKLGINAIHGMTDKDLDKMNQYVPITGDTNILKKSFTKKLSLQMTVHLIRALKVQYEQLWLDTEAGRMDVIPDFDLLDD